MHIIEDTLHIFLGKQREWNNGMKKIFVYGNRETRRNYAEALDACGAESVFSEDIRLAEKCGALLLPGGGDIDPSLYGQTLNGSRNIDREQDLREIGLVREFVRTGRPILGICRGIQVINVALGGTLIQDIATADTHKWEEETGDKVHPVTAAKGSFLHKLYGGTFSVNSAHHQAVDTVAPGLAVSARASDRVIEGLEDQTRGIYGVQWHPERMAFRHARTDTVDGRPLFEFFLKLCP